jgi:hypothetical protein
VVGFVDGSWPERLYDAHDDGRLSVEHTKMSILDVLPLGTPRDTLDRLESRWKKRLQTRFPDRGYNAN